MDQIQESPDVGAAKGWKLVTAHHHGMARVSICIGRPPDLHRVEIEIAYKTNETTGRSTANAALPIVSVVSRCSDQIARTF